MASAFLGLQTVGAVLSSDEPAINWVVKDTVAKEGVTFIVARAGAGKSLFAAHMGACVLTGTPLFGTLPVTQGAVVYVDLDMHRARLTGMRVAAALRGVGLDDAEIAAAPYHIAAQQSSADLRDPDVLGKVIAELAAVPHLALVVLDSFSDLHHGKEQSPDDMTDTMSGAVAIATQLKCGVLVLHHARKGGNTELEDVRGASAIVAKADAVFIIKTERDDDGNPGKLTLLQRKARLTEEARPRQIALETNGDVDGALHAYGFALAETGPVRMGAGGRPAEATTEAERIATRLLWQTPDTPKPELVKQLMDAGVAKTTAYRVAGVRFSQNPANPTPAEVLGNAETPTVASETGSQNPVLGEHSQKSSGNPPTAHDAAREMVRAVQSEHPDAPPARVDALAVARLEDRGYPHAAAVDAVWQVMDEGSTA